MEVNCVFYESMAIGHHYRSKKSLALAYLMTIGSKALVLTEVGDGDIVPACPVSVQKSFDDEAAIQRKIIHEEQVQLFQRSLDDKPGVSVLKKGRNGEFRQIYIRVKDDPKKNGKAVVWHSRMGGKKVFSLDPSMSVNILKTVSTTAASTPTTPQNSACNSPLSGSSTHSTQSVHNNSSNSLHSVGSSNSGNSSHHSKDHLHPHTFNASVPILCLSNPQRKLVIQFSSVSEANVCLHLLKSLGIKDPNIDALATDN